MNHVFATGRIVYTLFLEIYPTTVGSLLHVFIHEAGIFLSNQSYLFSDFRIEFEENAY